MNSARFRYDGLAQLITALRRLPEELTENAGRIVSEAADAAAADIRSQYPEVTGNLKGHVSVVTKNAGRFGVVRQVRSSAKHAYIFESGTATRQTALGYNRGFMPGANIFIPTAQRHRREMYQNLRELLREAGLDVRG